jgi:hypothetical protein
MALEQARTVQEGQMVVIDAQVFLDGDHACLRQPKTSNLTSTCPPELSPAPEVKLAGSRRYRCAFEGPVLARVRGNAFTEIVQLGTPINCRPIATPSVSENRRADYWHPTLSAGLNGVLDSGHVLPLGSDVLAGLEYHFEVVREPKPSDRASEALLGDAAGFGLRGRITSGVEHGRLTTVSLLSLEPWIRHKAGDFQLPTLLTPFLPEPGLAVRSDGPTRFFLGSSIPLRYGVWQFQPSAAWLPSSGQVLYTISFGVWVQE